MKSIIKMTVIGILAMMSTSCLDHEPESQLGGDKMWTSAEDYNNFANMFYNWPADFSSRVRNGSQHCDGRSDIMYDKNSFDVYSNGTNAIPTSDGTYGGSYDKIRRCNLLLENAENFSHRDDIAQNIGEAYFFRAYVYFDLLQVYGDVIIVDKTIDVDDALMSAPRNDRSEVADFIIADLNNAIEYLKGFDAVPAGRISREGAQAFLSRVALYEGTWQKFRGNEARAHELLDIAAKSAKAVIDCRKFQLFKSDALGNSAYRYMFVLEDQQSNPANVTKSANHEYIFSKCHDEVLKPIGFNISYGHCANAALVTQKFAALFLCQDGLPTHKSGMFQGYTDIKSEWNNRDNRMSQILMPPGATAWCAGYKPQIKWDGTDAPQISNFNPVDGSGYYTWKWVSERNVESGDEGFDYPVIRYAEVLLNYAEAVYERDGAISDDDLNRSLNLTRLRINPTMPVLSNAFASANALDMREEIRRERTIELFDEGFRVDDLKRWKTAETEMPMNLLGSKFAQPTASRNHEGFLIVETGRQWAEKNYLYPLPVDQVRLNPNLKQNPGWGEK